MCCSSELRMAIHTPLSNVEDRKEAIRLDQYLYTIACYSLNR